MNFIALKFFMILILIIRLVMNVFIVYFYVFFNLPFITIYLVFHELLLYIHFKINF